MLLTLLANNNLNRFPPQPEFRATVVTPPKPAVKYPELPQPLPLALLDQAPACNIYDALPPAKRWPTDQIFNAPDLIANLPPNLYDGALKANLNGDIQAYNAALLTPTVIVVQPQPVTDYPAPAYRVWPGYGIDFPNIVSISPPAPTPQGPTDAGRHHKRFKVFLGGRAVYFATRQEAEAARERHRDGLLLEVKAAGLDPRKVKVRRARITQVTVDGRHPPDLAPARQIARSYRTTEDEILQALKEARMREEEEIALMLLLQ